MVWLLKVKEFVTFLVIQILISLNYLYIQSFNQKFNLLNVFYRLAKHKLAQSYRESRIHISARST